MYYIPKVGNKANIKLGEDVHEKKQPIQNLQKKRIIPTPNYFYDLNLIHLRGRE